VQEEPHPQPASTPPPERERPSVSESLAPSVRPAAGPAAPREPLGPSSRHGSAGPASGVESGRGHTAPWAPRTTKLSPRMTAVFGALFGLACVTSIIALLIQGATPVEERAEARTIEAAPDVVAEPDAPKVPTIESRKPKRVALPSPWRLKDMAGDPKIVIVSDHMKGRAFVKAVQAKGVPKAQVYRILKAFDGVRNFDRTKKKDRFIIAMNRSGKKIRAVEYVVSPLEIYQAREDDQGLLRSAKLDMKIAEHEVVTSFYITDDIEKSFGWGGLEEGILEEINDAFNGRISTESFKEGGTVRLVANEMTALGLFAKYKNLVAVEYRPPDPEEKPVRAYWFKGDKAKGYFDDRGRQPFRGGWRKPCPDAPVTSRFNPKRMHPVLKTVRPHNGTDFGAPTGTPVHASYRGKVSFVGNAGASGNLVKIVHAGGVETGYAHLSKFAPGVKNGDRVGTFQIIGYVGSTGRSTGPHLHFSAKRNGKFFNAETLKLDGVRVMPVPDRPGFLARKAELDMRLDGIALPEPPPEPVEPPPADETNGKPAEGDSKPDGKPDADGKPDEGDEKNAPNEKAKDDAPSDDSTLQGANLGD